MTVVNYGGGERLIKRIPLNRILVTHNPRRPCPALQEAMEGKPLIDMVQELALSTDAEERAAYVTLMEQYEKYTNGIVELAKSRAETEIEPVLLRPYRKGGVGEPFYGIISGERRVLAQAYNFAKTGLDQFKDIGADVRHLNLEQAERLAFAENYNRKNMTELEIGEYLRRQMDKLRENGEKASLKSVAEENGMDYQYARSREALTYLPENLKTKLATGDLGVTEASNIGYEIKTGERSKDGTPKDGGTGIKGRQEHRAKMLTLKEANELFDASRSNKSNDFLMGIVACMKNTAGKTPDLSEVLEASDKRIAERNAA